MFNFFVKQKTAYEMKVDSIAEASLISNDMTTDLDFLDQNVYAAGPLLSALRGTSLAITQQICYVV